MNKVKKNILSLNNEEARNFFLKHESYANMDLPPYIKFNSLLENLSNKMKDKDYLEIKKDPPPEKLENINYTLLYNKNGKYDWRPLQLIHPILYISLVNGITKSECWKEIKERFKTIKNESVVECISLPIISESKNSDKAEQILNWWEEIEQKSLEMSLEFNYIYHTDILNCYSSIYTHSIPWAIHSKDKAKKERKNEKLIGNIIDRHLQAMSYGQTNGIPQGSVLMDFIAEIVLNYADLLLSKKLHNLEIFKIKENNYKILRYRDDYRIFVNNPIIADEIIKQLSEVLIDLGLKLNAQKTINSDNVIHGSIKPDKIEWMMCRRNSTTIQKELLILHNFSHKYKNSGTLIKELQQIFHKLEKRTNNNEMLQKFLKKENINVLISIVTDIAYHNPRTYPISIAILSKLFNLIEDKTKVEIIVKKILKKFKNIPNTGQMEIWLQRAIIKLDINNHPFNEKICKIVDEQDIELWNNEWLNNNNLIKILKKNSFVDREKIKEIDKNIQENEISVFKY